MREGGSCDRVERTALKGLTERGGRVEEVTERERKKKGRGRKRQWESKSMAMH